MKQKYLVQIVSRNIVPEINLPYIVDKRVFEKHFFEYNLNKARYIAEEQSAFNNGQLAFITNSRNRLIYMYQNGREIYVETEYESLHRKENKMTKLLKEWEAENDKDFNDYIIKIIRGKGFLFTECSGTIRNTMSEELDINYYFILRKNGGEMTFIRNNEIYIYYLLGG